VGDLAQQTKLFTIRSWGQLNEEFTDENTVRLEKVYRSTKQILEYVRAQGYEIPVPESARPGDTVEIIHIDKRDNLEAPIRTIISAHTDVTIGILSMNQSFVNQLAHLSTPESRVKVLLVSEAQGVEFDVVLLCASHEEDTVYPQELVPQIEQVRKDLLYVALTRAMNKLYILKIA
jgi:DNA helicase IV